MRLAKSVCVIVASLVLAAGVWAQAKQADVRVTEAWARATPPMASIAGGYLTLENTGGQPDRLLRVESDIAKAVEIHEMRNDGGIMRMRMMHDGLELPAHGRLTLAPGGYHLMLIGPKRPLVAGEHFNATVVLQRAGKLQVQFEVRGLGAGAH